MHPYLQQAELRRWCTERSILITAYGPLCPITKPALIGGPIDAPVAAAAAAHEKTPAQVLLRWCLQQGCGVLTTTSQARRLAEYLETFSFRLSDDEVSAISEAGKQMPRRCFWTQCPQYNEDPREEHDK